MSPKTGIINGLVMYLNCSVPVTKSIISVMEIAAKRRNKFLDFMILYKRITLI